MFGTKFILKTTTYFVPFQPMIFWMEQWCKIITHMNFLYVYIFISFNFLNFRTMYERMKREDHKIEQYYCELHS